MPNRFVNALKTAFAPGARVRQLSVAAVLLVLGIVGGAVYTRYYERAVEEHPYVAVILSDEQENFTIPEELQEGIRSRGTVISTGNGPVQIRFFIGGREPQRIRRTVHDDCLVNKDCIAIVGNSDSTTTTIMLAEILAFEGAKPTLLMPIATATSLTETAAREHYTQLLRLVPNNDIQARVIKSFMASRAGLDHRVTVIIDHDNPDYSKNLSDLLVDMVVKNGGVARTVTYLDASTLEAEAARPDLGSDDFFVFVGTSSSGLEVLNDMRRLNIRVPIILTDGNTVRELTNRSIGMPGVAYFLTPVDELNNVNEPAYTDIGRDTYGILSAIFEGTPHLTRSAVAAFVTEHKLDITLESGAAGKYNFDGNGENKGMEFHIFNMRPDGSVQVQRGY